MKEETKSSGLDFTETEWLLIADCLDYCCEQPVYLGNLKMLHSIIERIETRYEEKEETHQG